MLESLDFHYDGISSKDMGLMNVRMDSGLFEEIFLPNRSINKVKVKGTDKSYFQSIQREDISLPLTFMMPDPYTEEQERQIKRWFNQDYYKEFYFDDYPHRVFYVMYSGDSKLYHNGIGQGYFTITLESNSPFSYSPVYSSPYLSVNDVVNGYIYEFENNGDLPIYPELWISNCLYSDIKIHNLSNGVKFEFVGEYATVVGSKIASPETDLTGISDDAKLIITINTIPYELNKTILTSVTGTGKSITDLLSTINTAIGTNGTATNDLGRIRITSSTTTNSNVTVTITGTTVTGIYDAFGIISGTTDTGVGTGITTTETIFVDNTKKDILTDLPNTYRYDNFNGEWLKLDRGKNRLLIIGDCDIQFRYQLTFA